jgi:protease I
MNTLNAKRVAILATNGFEENELSSPLEALQNAGAKVDIVSDTVRPIRSWKNDNWGRTMSVDQEIGSARAEDYDALVLPGGVINPDRLRRNDKVQSFVRNFFHQHKPVGAICHGPQVLIDAEVLKGRKITSFPSIRKDIENAGAQWVNEEVVVDEGLVSSRRPEDLGAFNKKMIEEIREGKHAEQEA